MIEFHYATHFKLEDVAILKSWISNVVSSEGFELGDIAFNFCDDNYLHKLNVEFLAHDTLTDILTFDYGIGKQIHGEIYISVDRVAENAKDYDTDFQTEMNRVIIHGILHLCGYKDKTGQEEMLMRNKEDEMLQMLWGMKQ